MPNQKQPTMTNQKQVNLKKEADLKERRLNMLFNIRKEAETILISCQRAEQYVLKEYEFDNFFMNDIIKSNEAIEEQYSINWH